MDPAFITPFIASIQNVFTTMMQLPVTIGDPRIKAEPATTFDVSGIIGMSGDVVGSVVLSFPISTAQRLVALFTGTEMKHDNPDFADAIGELTNMISGNAKGMFAGKKKVTISCPSVIVGQNHTVQRPRDIPCIVIPCSTDCGDLVIEIAIQDRSAAPTAAAAAGATAPQ
ncbi:MAG: chemotaxis protein CheX [Phycisphaerales bacterium]|jgi:chemotaxis protein CheX|nr:chemotaxis protein CheX [Phycisphaeraceae bacterium]